MKEKPGMFPDCSNGCGVASVVIVGAMLAGVIVGGVFWALFIQ